MSTRRPRAWGGGGGGAPRRGRAAPRARRADRQWRERRPHPPRGRLRCPKPRPRSSSPTTTSRSCRPSRGCSTSTAQRLPRWPRSSPARMNFSASGGAAEPPPPRHHDAHDGRPPAAAAIEGRRSVPRPAGADDLLHAARGGDGQGAWVGRRGLHPEALPRAGAARTGPGSSALGQELSRARGSAGRRWSTHPPRSHRLAQSGRDLPYPGPPHRSCAADLEMLLVLAKPGTRWAWS